MKKVLIVGGAGYIGGYMTDYFLETGEYDVTVYDNLLYEDRYMKPCPFIAGDIRDHEKLKKALDTCDVVIWLAAIVGDGACAIDQQLTEEINSRSVEWLANHFDKKIVFMSTCSVYGANDSLIDETAEVHPLSIYAATKLEAERYIANHSSNHLIFRLGTLYGIGDTYSRLRFDLVANLLTLKAVYGQLLTVYGGEQWRPLLHVRDVAHAVDYCLRHNVNGLYNLSERNVIIKDLAQAIQKIIPSTEITYQEAKFEDLRNYHVKNEKISTVGWKPKQTMEEGIREMKRVFEEGRIKNINDPVYSNVAYLRSLGGIKDGKFIV